VLALDTTYPLRDVDDWLTLLPPQPVRLSPMQIRRLLCVSLPQPLFDQDAALALITYQQRHKQAAYRSHRAQRLLRAYQTLAPTTTSRTSRLTAALALPRGDHVSL
jgi:hypothetical protein